MDSPTNGALKSSHCTQVMPRDLLQEFVLAYSERNDQFTLISSS